LLDASTRRNLSASQRGFLAAELLPLIEKESKERQKRKPKSVSATGHEQNGKSTDKAAAATGASGRTTARAKKVIESGCKQLQQSAGAKTPRRSKP